MKQLKKFYRLTVWLIDEEYDDDEYEPQVIDYNTMEEAVSAYYQYYDEYTISGSHAYSVSGPDVIESYVNVTEEIQ